MFSGLVVAMVSGDWVKMLSESLLEHDPRRGESFLPDDRTLPKAARARSMRRIMRKSVPFVVALLIGSLLGVMVAGFAVLAAHS
jgi:hypothetical protein